VIQRDLEPVLLSLAGKFPVVTLTGPRQSGKTTLARAAFPDKAYVSLEPPDRREFAISDPRGFLSEYPDGAILDEVHRAPDLLSYIQSIVDSRKGPGRFILTGSANFALLASLGQSLAGRTALVELPGLSLAEIRRFGKPPTDLFDLLWRGGYPAVYDRRLEPGEWYPSYVRTYLERDVRTLLNVGDLLGFQTFLRLVAGRTAQLVNLSSLGADAGVSHATARSWLSVLEAGYLVWRLPPFHANVSKRLIRTPKLHFLDSGLVCYLLGIRSPQHLKEHPLRGAVFETWVASEILKTRAHRGLDASLFHYRDRKGGEVDLVVELGPSLIAVEAKSGQTLAGDAFRGLAMFDSLVASTPTPRPVRKVLVYGGTDEQKRSAGTVAPWSRLDSRKWW
jgi:predicted AAA+ superfamily ATPase